MKCPICQDEIVNGRCSFCGHRVTQADQEARARYAKQKADFERGGDTPDKKSQIHRQSRRPSVSKPEKPEAQGHSREPPVTKKPQQSRDSRRSRDGPHDKPVKKPVTGKHVKRSDRDSMGERPGKLKRLFFKLIVIGWVVLYLFLIGQKLIQDAAREREADPENQTTQVSDASSIYSGEGGS